MYSFDKEGGFLPFGFPHKSWCTVHVDILCDIVEWYCLSLYVHEMLNERICNQLLMITYYG
jgi:hypothetical protein